MLPKLTDMETKFRVHHHAPIIGYNGSLTKEQEVLDSNNDQIAKLGWHKYRSLSMPYQLLLVIQLQQFQILTCSISINKTQVTLTENL